MNAPLTTPEVRAGHRAVLDDAGYLVFPSAVPETVLARLHEEATRLAQRTVAAMEAARATDRTVTWWRLPTGGTYLFKIKPVLGGLPTARVLATGVIADLVARLAGTPARLMEDKLVVKQRLPADAAWADLPVLPEGVRKHSDHSYFAARGHSHGVLSVALCLDDCPPPAGPVLVWPGTHRRRIPVVHTAHQGPVVADDAAPDGDAVALTAPAGSLLVWHSALVHASGPNTSGRPRRLLVLGYDPQAPAP
jgi:hypothetical protein